ncbi:MAG: site-specific DNA-methyltransferase [Candidatus Limnocylindrales bacterium]
MPDEREHVARWSADVTADRIAGLEKLFPEAFAEGAPDAERLAAALGIEGGQKAERFSFSWAGKRDAIGILQMPSRATLLPCSSEAAQWDSTSHVYVEGDNLEVLKLMYRPYFGRVRMIFIDPPYNTGTDRVYADNYADPIDAYLRLTKQIDGNGGVLTSNPESGGRFHSSWLSMMYPRLFLARQILADDGVIFVTIDDTEAANLRLLMNEVFGEENFLAAVAWEKRYTRSNNAKLFYSLKDSILVYRKSQAVRVLRESRTQKSNAIYSNPDNDPRGDWTSSSYVNPARKDQRPNLVYQIKNPFNGATVEHPTNAWKYSKDEHKRHVAEKRLWWAKKGDAKYPRLKNFLSEMEEEGAGLVPIDIWDYKSSGTTDDGGKEVKDLFGQPVFDNPKPTRLIRRMLQLVTAPDEQAIILDFFAGSASTAHAVLAQNAEDGGDRRFIMVQLPELTPEKSAARDEGFNTISDVGKERVRRVAAALLKEKGSQLALDERAPLDLGFRVFKLAESNLKPWAGVEGEGEEAYADTMQMFTDPLVEGWQSENVIWEIVIKEGFSLTSAITELSDVKSNKVYRVRDAENEQQFTICLDDEIAPETFAALGLGKDDLFICRDAALTDEGAANLALQCRFKTI